MMRKLATVGFVVAMMGMGLAADDVPQPAARGGKSCSTRLGSNVYSCDVTKNDGTTFKDCLRFSSGVVSDGFDLTPDQLGKVLGCTCGAGGSKKRPSFASSPVFLCNADDYAFQGTVSGNGKVISKGIATLAAGTSFVFSCKLDAACALP